MNRRRTLEAKEEKEKKGKKPEAGEKAKQVPDLAQKEPSLKVNGTAGHAEGTVFEIMWHL